MTSTPAARTFRMHHLLLARAVIAAIAAAMITFSSDHSGAFGLATFSGFGIMTALVLLLAVWLVRPAPARGYTVLLAVPSLVAGMVAGVGAIRTETLFFVLVIVWGAVTGVIELVGGMRARRRAADAQARADARDAIVVGALGVLLAVALLLTPVGYAWSYRIAEAHRTFTLTGITIGVGIFGAYAAIVAVYLGIAAFSPRKDAAAEASDLARPLTSDEHSGGAA